MAQNLKLLLSFSTLFYLPFSFCVLYLMYIAFVYCTFLCTYKQSLCFCVCCVLCAVCCVLCAVLCCTLCTFTFTYLPNLPTKPTYQTYLPNLHLSTSLPQPTFYLLFPNLPPLPLLFFTIYIFFFLEKKYWSFNTPDH